MISASQLAQWEKEVDMWKTRASAAEAKLAIAVEALQWYAGGDLMQGEFTIIDEDRGYVSDMRSFGQRAREALRKIGVGLDG
jgi:hypothetical protein